jgi:outer membrane receptor protein involved in Fe transport
MYLPNVTITQADVEGSYLLSPGNSATLTASLNSTVAKDSANSVPNIPAFSFSGVYRRSIGSGVDIEGYARYMSKRWTSFAHSASNAGFVDIGAKGEYQFLENLRAVLAIDNLLSEHYYLWDGYVEQPMFISLSVTYKW